MFNLCERVEVGRSGTGAGLALVRKLVERMGGRVGVESEAGHGSRFRLKPPKALEARFAPRKNG